MFHVRLYPQTLFPPFPRRSQICCLSIVYYVHSSLHLRPVTLGAELHYTAASNRCRCSNEFPFALGCWNTSACSEAQPGHVARRDASLPPPALSLVGLSIPDDVSFARRRLRQLCRGIRGTPWQPPPLDMTSASDLSKLQRHTATYKGKPGRPWPLGEPWEFHAQCKRNAPRPPSACSSFRLVRLCFGRSEQVLPRFQTTRSVLCLSLSYLRYWSTT